MPSVFKVDGGAVPEHIAELVPKGHHPECHVDAITKYLSPVSTAYSVSTGSAPSARVSFPFYLYGLASLFRV